MTTADPEEANVVDGQELLSRLALEDLVPAVLSRLLAQAQHENCSKTAAATWTKPRLPLPLGGCAIAEHREGVGAGNCQINAAFRIARRFWTLSGAANLPSSATVLSSLCRDDLEVVQNFGARELEGMLLVHVHQSGALKPFSN